DAGRTAHGVWRVGAEQERGGGCGIAFTGSSGCLALVAQRLGGGQHPLPRVRANAALVAQDKRDGRRRRSALSCDIRDGDALLGHIQTPCRPMQSVLVVTTL